MEKISILLSLITSVAITQVQNTLTDAETFATVDQTVGKQRGPFNNGKSIATKPFYIFRLNLL